MRHHHDDRREPKTRPGLAGAAAFAPVAALQHLPWSRIEHLTLSLRGVDGIDASGVAALVRLYSQLASRGKVLKLCHVSDRVRPTLDAVGLSDLVEIVDDPRRGTWIDLITQRGDATLPPWDIPAA